MSTDPPSAREEAERLVASVLALASAAVGGTGGTGGTEVPHRFATGSAECCVCPVCRLMAAMRDPDPQFAERLATGAGDLAAGLASLLRAFGAPEPGPGSAPATEAPAGVRPEAGSGPGAAGTAGAGDDAAAAGNRAGTGDGVGAEGIGPDGVGPQGAGAGERDAGGPGSSGEDASDHGPGARAKGGPWPWSEFTWPRTDAWGDPDDPWRAATRGTGPPPAAEPPGSSPPATHVREPKPMAKKAVRPRLATPPSPPPAG